MPQELMGNVPQGCLMGTRMARKFLSLAQCRSPASENKASVTQRQWSSMRIGINSSTSGSKQDSPNHITLFFILRLTFLGKYFVVFVMEITKNNPLLMIGDQSRMSTLDFKFVLFFHRHPSFIETLWFVIL